MKILVAGANGATGKLLVEQLLDKKLSVIAIVRSPDNFPKHLSSNEQLTLVGASILEMNEDIMKQYIGTCDAVISCLGHNMSWKGIYGEPQKLVTEATQKICNAIKSNKNKRPTKYILMNTAGNSNRDLHESISFSQKLVINLIRLLLPPHVDNENASDYLRTVIGSNEKLIQWVVVRPDSLFNDPKVTDYEVYPSPTRSAIFNPGRTSRINVGNFMLNLVRDPKLWEKWKGQMPVIYNK